MIDGICIGYSRFSHMEVLQQDPGYLLVKGCNRFPNETTFRRFLAKFKPEHLEQLRQLNLKLLWRKARTENAREVWIDIDDTVITLFGKQEGGKIGYNPRYHGRPSLKLRVAFIAETGELIHLQLIDGKANPRRGFLDFIKEIETALPPNYILRGIRADSGFPDQEVMGYLEERQIAYVFKLPKKATVKKAISFLEHEPAFWELLDKTKKSWEVEESWAVADIRLTMTNWSKDRRVVIYREPEVHPQQDGQLTLPLVTYTYQAIVTNLEPDEMAPVDLYRFYNGRANIENRIDELKEGYSMEQQSQHELIRNQAFTWLKAIAYNLLTWFKHALLPADLQKGEITTIRRKILVIAGNIVGSGRYRHVKLAQNPRLQKIVCAIQKSIDAFIPRLIPALE